MRSRIITKTWIKVAVISILILVIATLILNKIISQQISHQLQSLSPAIKIRYASISSNLLTASVYLKGLEIDFTPYDNLPQSRHTLHFSNVSFNGINFFKLLLSKKFSVSNMRLEKGNIMVDQFLLDKRDSLQAEIFEKIKMPFKSIGIHAIELSGIRACMNTESLGPALFTGDLAIHEVQMFKKSSSTGETGPRFAAIECNLSDLNYSGRDSSTILHIRRLILDSKKEFLRADSIQITRRDRQIDQNNLEVNIPLLKVTKTNMVDLFQNKLTAEKIFVPYGNIKINNGKTMIPSELPLPALVHIKTLQVDQISVSYKDPEQKLSFNGALSVDDGALSGREDSFSYGTIRCRLSGLNYFNTSHHHTVAIKDLQFDSEKEIIGIHDVKIIPEYGKYEFGRKLGHQADRAEAVISAVEIVKPDIRRLFQNRLVAEQMMIGESKVYVFRDRRLPRPVRYVPMPVEYMKRLPLNIRIKTCVLATSSVAYEEYPAQGFGVTGVLRIERIRATISPLINHPVDSDPDHMTMHINGSVMGSGTVHGTLIMPLRSNRPYHMTGAIENLELTKLNSSSENLGKIRIKSGLLDLLSFDFVMTNEKSTGKIVGAYHNLIIQQLKKHTGNKNVADFASFMLRHLIIPLDKDRSLPEKKRTGNVDFTRDPSRFFSNYFLQSLLMGVKKSFTLGFLLPKAKQSK